ncbi:MAG: hypothetical protein HYT61_02220 [Candidatus Yanofskybacteria bacterium]|nr:hypothetical protein [Candidatus Yanofskybacteria bacterium]
MSTKIIHVLKNENFDEVFDLFKNTESEEVIFIFPKGSKLARQSQHFTAIKREADSSGKHVSIMTSDPIVEQFASQNKIELIKSPEIKKHDSPTVISTSEQTTVEQYAESEPDIQLAAVKTTTMPKVIKDIVRPEYETKRPIKIKEETTNPFDVEITRGIKEEKIAGDITSVWARTNQDTARIKKIKASGIFRKTPFFLASGAVLVLILVLYTTLGSARIIISPQKQDLNFPLKISASSLATSVDFDFNRIPGQRFGYKDSESGTFEATGQKDVAQKASGKITIYNKGFTTQRLVATTRFKSQDGLIFRIPQTITVPAATKTGTVATEGVIESAVYADRPGPEYNIAPTTFSVPGLEGTPKFEDFYAESEKPMTGGVIGLSKVVTEEDFIKGQEAVTAKLKEKILQSLNDQAGELKILDSIMIKFDPPISNAKVGEAVENFQITVGGTASTLAFRESDILELIKNYISQKGNLELVEKNLTLNSTNPQNNTDNTTMTFDMQVSGQAAVKVDQEKILKDIQGMKEDAIRDYFKNMKEVESARITLSPFWVKSIPKDQTRIKISIEKE